jgi:undecaprenyl-diphosphatase
MPIEHQFDYFMIFVLAVVQGITELFPVSSLGHSIILPHLIGRDIDLKSASFLPLLVTMHLGTAFALLIYFRKDWVEIFSGIMQKNFSIKNNVNNRILYFIIIGTIPAGLIGLILRKPLGNLFSDYRVVCVFLVLNGCMLLIGELLRKRNKLKELSALSTMNVIFIGISQALALLPGFSRSGATLVAGMLTGLKNEDAARFSFLLATPIILAAGVLEVPKLFKHEMIVNLLPAVFGGVCAGIIAYLSTWFLMRYFKTHEINALFPFGIYCILLGGVVLFLF